MNIRSLVSNLFSRKEQPQPVADIIPMRNSRSKSAPVVTEWDLETVNVAEVVPLEFLKETLTPNHYGAVVRQEFWWALIGNPDAFTKTGDCSAFWTLVRSMGNEPLGFTKGTNPYTGRDQSLPISDPMEVVKGILEGDRIRDRNLAMLTEADVVNIAKLRGVTPASIVHQHNEERKVLQEKAKEAEAASIRMIAAVAEECDGTDYLIPKKRCLSRMLSSQQFSAKAIKNPLFAEAEAILWNDEIAKVKNLHVKGETVRAKEQEEVLFDRSVNF